MFEFLARVLVVVVVVIVAVWGYFTWDRRYRGAEGAPERFKRTDETFRDPTTQRMMRVYSDPTTGERQYREEPGASS